MPNIKDSNSNKRYKDFYDLYYQNFLQNKMRNHNGTKKGIKKYQIYLKLKELKFKHLYLI